MNFFNFNKSDVNKNILYNKYLLYFIFIISFGNFFIELMNNNMYFVVIYIIIGLLTSFFNKNMIVILSMSVIFANILNYGKMSTVEGYEDEFEAETDHEHENDEENEVDKALGTKPTDDDGIIDELVDQEIKKRKNKKKKNKEDDEEDNDEEDEDTTTKSKKKEGLTELNDDLDINYDKADKLLDKQKDILKNLNQYKPFLETIQGIAKNSGLSKVN